MVDGKELGRARVLGESPSAIYLDQANLFCNTFDIRVSGSALLELGLGNFQHVTFAEIHVILVPYLRGMMHAL